MSTEDDTNDDELEMTVKALVRLELGRDPEIKLHNNPVGRVFFKGDWITYGLSPGSGDLIGYHSVIVTPEMVGQRVAIFASVETKRRQGGRKGEKQVNWAEQITAAGGIAGFANSPEAARKLFYGD